MKLLVSTKETQGQRKNDYSWTEDGELLFMGMGLECDGESVDGRCGCKRGFSGLTTHKATTTAKVVEIDFTKEEILNRLEAHFRDDWQMKPDECVQFAKDCLEDALHVTSIFKVGAVVERRGERIQTRKVLEVLHGQK